MVISRKMEMRPSLVTVALAAAAALWPCGGGSGLNTLPDASQEGLLSQFSGYASLTVFHYTVPPEVTRATWEFASFQDHGDCPHRRVRIFLQQGSYPVFSGDNTSLPSFYYLDRTSPSNLTVSSEFQPDGSEVHAVYNPLPGSWFAVAYLENYEEPHGLSRKCRYSLGSIALWTRADGGVQLILSHSPQFFRTRRHFSYFRFHVPDAVDAFKLVISDCSIVARTTPRANPDARRTCIDFVDIRAGALPFHDPDSSLSGVANITDDPSNPNSKSNATFFEPRPHRDTTYYVIVVSHGEVEFKVDLRFKDCGEPGLYGRRQRDWYLSERGLMWAEEYDGSQHPKEPTTGFQLFSTRPLSKILKEAANNSKQEEEINALFFDPNFTGKEDSTLDAYCHSTFDFTRVDNLAEFTVNYLLQGRSWYTKWLTVVERSPVVTRFDTRPFLDIGGFVNVRLRMDDDKMNGYMYQVIRACLLRGRQPDVSGCPSQRLLTVSNERAGRLEAMRVVPFPEPGKWYLGFQAHCVERRTNVTGPCPKSLEAAMVSVEIRIQPCDHRPPNDICGEHGVCAKASKGRFRFSACQCFSGYGGWTCDEPTSPDSEFYSTLNTLLLTLSNLAFLPAVILAIRFGLFTEALIYFATMAFSTFYHTCDQEALTSNLPTTLERACGALYVNREVLQFCDFYCATLSFWITIISLARLPNRLVNFLHLFGVILVAVLVQYNRTGFAVFVIPVPLAALVLVVALTAKAVRRGCNHRSMRPNATCAALLATACACALVALCLNGFAETSLNYPYVHSAWHILIATSLVFLLPRCKIKRKSRLFKVPMIDNKMAVLRCSCNTNSNNENDSAGGTDSTPAAVAEAGDNDHVDQSDLNIDRSDFNNDRSSDLENDQSDLNNDQIDHRSDLNYDHSDHNQEQERDDDTAGEAGHDPELVRKRSKE